MDFLLHNAISSGVIAALIVAAIVWVMKKIRNFVVSMAKLYAVLLSIDTRLDKIAKVQAALLGEITAMRHGNVDVVLNDEGNSDNVQHNLTEYTIRRAV